MKHLSEADETTLRKLCGPGGPLACRWCARCDRHYAHCTCSEPVWKLRTDGELGPLPGEPGGPVTLADKLGHW